MKSDRYAIEFKPEEIKKLKPRFEHFEHYAKDKFGVVEIQGLKIWVTANRELTDKETRLIATCFHSYVHGFIDGIK